MTPAKSFSNPIHFNFCSTPHKLQQQHMALLRCLVLLSLLITLSSVYGSPQSFTARRSAAEANESVLILAGNLTRRPDPNDDFRLYTGGWNINSNHYWASVTTTTVPMVAVALVWFVLFGLCLFCMCCCHYCCLRNPYGYPRVAYAFSLIILILFTIASITGCILLYTGQGKFHNMTSDTLSYTAKQADVTAEKLKNVSDYLAAAKEIRLNLIRLPDDVLTSIDNLQKKINASATAMATETQNKSKTVQRLLYIVRMVLVHVAAAMLLLVFFGFLFSLFGLRYLVHILVIIGWIMVAGAFILCGLSLLLHNVVTDSCVAIDELVRYPKSHPVWNNVLPCIDNTTAHETLLRSKDITFRIVTVVNDFVSNVSNQDSPPKIGMPIDIQESAPSMPIEIHGPGPKVPTLCNPFNSDNSERQCASGEVDLSNATTVWKNYVCQVSARGACEATGSLTPERYSEMASAVNVSYGLYGYVPFLVDLQDCTLVRQTFTDITEDYCPGLRIYSKWMYVGLVMITVAVMLSLIFWVIYGRDLHEIV